MRFLFTALLLFLLANSYTQSGTLSLGTSTTICSSGCNSGSPGTSPFCTSCGSYASGNCTEYELTEIVTVPAGQTVSITVTNANCGSSGSFDSSDEIIFRYNNGIEIAVAGNTAQTATRCFDNPSTVPLNVFFGFRSNRRDEFANWNYTITNGTGTGCLTLPVKFVNFDVAYKSKQSKLIFSTASETNNDFFTIERSIDGAEFDAIGEIKGAGNSSSELQYEYVDENPLPGINYYRVKQTDFDGKYSYTEIKSVRHHVGKITISPLRTNGRLQITSTQDNYDVALYNAAGQEVFRKNRLNGDQTIDIESLEAGIYFVKIVDQTFKIIKY